MQALLNAIQNTNNQKERNTLTVLLVFVTNAHPDILYQIEALIASSNDSTDTLILSYGALASTLSPLLQYQIVQFLVNRINNTSDPAIIVHYAHSLGNTQSKLANTALLRLMSESNLSIRLASVYALRYSTSVAEVQSALQHVLESYPSDKLIEVVLRSLISGLELEAQPINDQLFKVILNASQNTTELRMLLGYYIHLLGPKAPRSWTHVIKRDTTWNENSNLYNLIEDGDTRNADLQLYPVNKAYIWGKSFGVSEVSLDTAFGAFAGLGGTANPTNFKLFAKGIAQASAYGYTVTVFEALLLSENKPGGSSVENRLYVSIVGKVLVDFSKEIPTCKSWTYPLYKSQVYDLLKMEYKIPVYIGFLTFSIGLTAQLAVDANLAACINKCTSAQGALVPSVIVSAAADTTGSIAVSLCA